MIRQDGLKYLSLAAVIGGTGFALALGLARILDFEPGAGGEYKQLRGFDAQPTYSGHFLSEPRLSRAVEQFLEQEREHTSESIEWIREHSALKAIDR